MSNSKDIQRTNGIAVQSVSEMVAMLGNMYNGAIAHGVSFGSLPAVMLWGKPGVGKSQGVRQVAKQIADKTGRRVVVTDVRLLLFNPIDLRGIPTADANKQFAIWLRPKIFAMDASAGVVNILFLDEITSAPPSVQAAAYQITLDRVIGEHRLPDNCLVIAAGNRVTDRSVANKMPKALANRLCHIEVAEDYASWRAWAEQAKLDYRVLGFLHNRRAALCTFNPENDDVAFATPRSWQMVSNVLLSGCYANPKQAYALIAGCLGEGLATEFCTWCNTHAVIPDIDEIIAGHSPALPTTIDGMYATVRLLASAAGDCSDVVRTTNIVRYVTEFPADFAACCFSEIKAKGNSVVLRLVAIQEFGTWLKRHGKLLC